MIFPINGDLKQYFFNFSHFYMTKSSVVIDFYIRYALKKRVIDHCDGNSKSNGVIWMETSPINGDLKLQERRSSHRLWESLWITLGRHAHPICQEPVIGLVATERDVMDH